MVIFWRVADAKIRSGVRARPLIVGLYLLSYGETPEFSDRGLAREGVITKQGMTGRHPQDRGGLHIYIHPMTFRFDCGEGVNVPFRGKCTRNVAGFDVISSAENFVLGSAPDAPSQTFPPDSSI